MAITKFTRLGNGNTNNTSNTIKNAINRQNQQNAAAQQTNTQTQSQIQQPTVTQTNNGSNASGYNPYYDVNSIVQNKGSYNESKYANNSNDYDKYRINAEQYYESLRNNGYSTVADELSNSSYEKALEILARLQPNSSSQTGNVGIESSNHGDIAADYLSKIQGYLQPSQTTQDTISGAANYAANLLNLYQNGLNNVNSQSQNLQDTTYKYINDQSGRYDALNNYNLNTNPYSTETAKAILATYGVKGANASDDAVASSSGDNGGNIDSYAAANAKRQQLAFTTAGNEAVRNDFDSRVTRSLQILQSLGVDVGDALDKVGGNIDSQITQNNNTLSGANDVIGTAINGTVSLDQNKTNAVMQILTDISNLAQSEVNAAVIRDGYASQETIEKIRAELQEKLTQMGIDSSTSEAAADYALQQLKNQGDYNVQQLKNQGDYNVASTNAGADIYSADKKYSETELKETNKYINDMMNRNTGVTDSSNPTYSWIISSLEDVIDQIEPNNVLSSEAAMYNDKVTRAANILLTDSTYGQFSDLIKAAKAQLLKKTSSGTTSSASSAAANKPASASNGASNISGLFN